MQPERICGEVVDLLIKGLPAFSLDSTCTWALLLLPECTRVVVGGFKRNDQDGARIQ